MERQQTEPRSGGRGKREGWPEAPDERMEARGKSGVGKEMESPGGGERDMPSLVEIKRRYERVYVHPRQ